MKAVGIDLAGSEKRTTGFCLLDGRLRVRTKPLHTDDEIIEESLRSRSKIVSIDAPLSLPRGRDSLFRPGPPHLRKCDKELQKMKIRFFPVTLGPMRRLTERGIRLKGAFESAGLKVIESYSGGVQDMLGMPRKQEGLEKLRHALLGYGFTGDVAKKEITHDELDAITCALVGKMFLEGNYLAIGDMEEGLMILPSRKASSNKFLAHRTKCET